MICYVVIADGRNMSLVPVLVDVWLLWGLCLWLQSVPPVPATMSSVEQHVLAIWRQQSTAK
jgi:hypothetical protein